LDKKSVFLLGFLASVVILLAAALSRALWSGGESELAAPRAPNVPPQAAEPYSTPILPQAANRGPEYSPPPENYPLVPPPRIEVAGETPFIAATKELPESSKGRVLHFRITSPPRCMIGDLDIIREEINHSRKKNILLTLEPLLGGSDFPAQTSRIPNGELGRGVDHPLVLPANAQPLHAALYICKDDDGDGRCGRKPPAKMERIYTAYMQSRRRSLPAAEIEPGDKIYFFQYLLVEARTATVFNSDMSATSYNELVSFLDARGISTDEALAIVRRVRRLNTIIRSATVEVRGSFFDLVLPHVDGALCHEKGPQPLFKVKKKRRRATTS
jgi:hypothetical protein